jgi:5-formyltetrahydrofolate cyclo-ligase
MISEEKQRLRARLRALAGSSSAAPGDIRAMLERWPIWHSAKSVCAFAPIAGEPNVLDPWPTGKFLALPRIEGENLCAHFVTSPADLTAGRFGIPEPRTDAPAAGPSFDLILVPGLAFDRSGGRLGRGRGFYDRFLSGISGFRVGACFDWQLVDSVPVEAHDMRMDAIVTPSEIIVCGPGPT